MDTFLIYLDSALLRVTLTGWGVVDGQFEPSGDVPNGERRQVQTALPRHPTGRDVKTKAVRGAAKQAPFELAACNCCAVVRTGVFDGVEFALDVEKHNAAAFEEGELALSWREFIGRPDRYLARHYLFSSSTAERNMASAIAPGAYAPDNDTVELITKCGTPLTSSA
jgi:hypothetical protein